MVQRKTTDSNRTTRSDTRHPASVAKPLTNSDPNTEPESDSDLHSNNSDSDSSSSDTQPDTNHSDQYQTFILHRHLDYSYPHSSLQRPSNQPAGFDLFTAKTWQLDDQQLNQFLQLNDTDLVQIHHPVPIKQEPAKKLTLADILPPHQPSSSSSVHGHLSNKTRLPKLSASPFAGPSVSSLYYSAYSSFAPCYDSTTSTQTLDQARVQFQSKQKIDFWSRRAHRYHDVLTDTSPHERAVENLNSSTSSNNLKKKKSSAPATRGRKRQKTSSSSVAPSTPSSSAAKALTTPASPSKVRQEINATLLETSKLISNLQERQFDRLRLCQDVHLDPSLSSPPIYPRQDPAPNQLVVPEPSREELAEAYQLVQRLSSVIARRPRPAGSSSYDEDGHECTLETDQSVIPSADAIRQSYEILAIGAGADSASVRAVYTGLLPPTNPVGIHESTLVSKPSPQLISVLEHTQRSNPSVGSTPRISAGLPMGSSPQYVPHSVPGASSRRDPSLTNARIGTSGPPAMISTPEFIPNRPPLNGQAVHNNISKLQLLQQQHHTLPANHHHHPALHQPEQAIPVRPLVSSTSAQIDQQRHLQQLQVQKLLATSYANPAHHLMSTPSFAPPSIPTIATPSLKPVAASLAYHLDQNSASVAPNNLNIPHPNHRVLASSSSSATSHSALR